MSKKVKIGNSVEVQLKKIIQDNGHYYITLTCEISDKESQEDIIKEFNGIVNIIGSYGFADNVYIDQSLINENCITNNSTICGKAILNYNKKKNRWGWKAINISNSLTT